MSIPTTTSSIPHHNPSPNSTTNPSSPSGPSRHSLQLLNPSASPYVALTPGLATPDRHSSHVSPSRTSALFRSSKSSTHTSTPLPIAQSPTSHSSSATMGLSTSQHTLKTLAGGRYYDEYDEDEDPPEISPTSQPLYPSSPRPRPSPSQASFPPGSSPASNPPSKLSQPHRTPPRLKLQTANSFIIDLTPPSAHTQQHSSTHPPSASGSLTRSIPPARVSSLASSTSSSLYANRTGQFNFLSISDWTTLIEDRPMLSLAFRLGGLLVGCAILLSSMIWVLLPPVADEHRSTLRIPTSFEALKKLNGLLQVYKEKHYYRVLSSFVLIYLFLQAFSLPGSMYLSILAGAMYGVQAALPLVCLCVGTGALLCYVISSNLGAPIFLISPSLRNRLETWRLKLSTKTNRFDLFSYLVVIRISPLPPHWVVNLLAPHLGIDLGLFWLSTCVGILPVTLIHTQLGTTLDQMVGPEDLSFFNSRNLIGLGLVAVAVMIPVGIRWYWKSDVEEVGNEGVFPVGRRAGRARIGLSLEDEDDAVPVRPGRLRSLSGQSYDAGVLTANSSVSSLAALNRTGSSDTLVLSSSLLGRRTSSPHRTRLSSKLNPVTNTGPQGPHLKPGEEIPDEDEEMSDQIRFKKTERTASSASGTPLPLQGSKAARILGLSPNPGPLSPVDGTGGISLGEARLTKSWVGQTGTRRDR